MRYPIISTEYRNDKISITILDKKSTKHWSQDKKKIVPIGVQTYRLKDNIISFYQSVFSQLAIHMFPQIQKGRTAALLLFGTDGTPVII
jgi:hypothetical protein